MNDDEPARWRDGADGLGGLLSDASNERPSAESSERIAKGIGAVIGTSVVAGAATASAASAGGWLVSFHAKVLAVVIGVAGLGAATVALLPAEPGEREATTHPEAEEPRVMPAQAELTEPIEPVEVAAPVIEATQPVNEVGDVGQNHRARSSSRQRDDEAVRDEALALLLQARRRLTDSPRESLRLLREHNRSHPRSAFAQERMAMEIEARVRLGQLDRARRQAERFEARFPGSPHLRRILGLVSRSTEGTEGAVE